MRWECNFTVYCFRFHNNWVFFSCWTKTSLKIYNKWMNSCECSLFFSFFFFSSFTFWNWNGNILNRAIEVVGGNSQNASHFLLCFYFVSKCGLLVVFISHWMMSLRYHFEVLSFSWECSLTKKKDSQLERMKQYETMINWIPFVVLIHFSRSLVN